MFVPNIFISVLVPAYKNVERNSDTSVMQERERERELEIDNQAKDI